MKAEGTDARLTMLYESHHDEVLAYCTRRAGRTEADEATADVFAVAWCLCRHRVDIDPLSPPEF